jgi:hypothetical protein
MSESIKILIEAENKASAVIDAAAKDVEAKVKGIKSNAEQAKKSTEFFGSIASALGGTEVGAFASQLAGLTDKTSQFAEVQKLGGAGALAFKAGLVAAVGVIAFQFGQALGNAIFQTEKWKEKLAEANAEAQKLNATVIQQAQNRFSDSKSDIELIQDPEAKQAKYKELLDNLTKDVFATQDVVQKGRKEVEEWNAAWFKTGNRAAFADQAKAKLEDDKTRLKVLEAQRLELQKITGDHAKQNAELARSGPLMNSLQDELSMIAASQEDVAKKGIFVGETAGSDALREEIKLLEERSNIAAIEEKVKQGRLGAAASETTELMIQVELAKKKADLAKEEVAQRAKSRGFVDSLQKELAAAEASRNDAAKQKTNFTGPDANLKALAEEIRLLEQKKNIEAITEKAKMGTVDADQAEAEALLLKIALSQKKMELGNAEQEQAKRIAELKASELQKIAEQNVLLTKGKEAAYAFRLEQQGLSKQDAAMIASKQQKTIASPTTLQASESRLLTRGTGDDPTRQVAVNTANAFRELQLLNKRLAESGKNNVTLKLVGSGI